MTDVRRFEGLPPTTQGFSGQTPVHFEGHPKGPFEGVGRWVGVREFEHGHLCRCFGLDPNRFYFDLPSSVRGTGSNRGDGRARTGTVEGFVFMSGRDEPVASLYVLRDGDKLRDFDPNDRGEHERFGWRR